MAVDFESDFLQSDEFESTERFGGDQFDVYLKEPGPPGFSPIAKTERFNGYATITITDSKGTTESSVYDGENVEALSNLDIEELLNNFA